MPAIIAGSFMAAVPKEALTAVAPEIADAARQPGLTYVLWLGTACARDQHLACAERAGVSRCRP